MKSYRALELAMMGMLGAALERAMSGECLHSLVWGLLR